jgi:hypothetical protein
VCVIELAGFVRLSGCAARNAEPQPGQYANTWPMGARHIGRDHQRHSLTCKNVRPFTEHVHASTCELTAASQKASRHLPAVLSTPLQCRFVANLHTRCSAPRQDSSPLHIGGRHPHPSTVSRRLFRLLQLIGRLRGCTRDVVVVELTVIVSSHAS